MRIPARHEEIDCEGFSCAIGRDNGNLHRDRIGIRRFIEEKGVGDVAAEPFGAAPSRQHAPAMRSGTTVTGSEGPGLPPRAAGVVGLNLVGG